MNSKAKRERDRARMGNFLKYADLYALERESRDLLKSVLDKSIKSHFDGCYSVGLTAIRSDASNSSTRGARVTINPRSLSAGDFSGKPDKLVSL